MQITELRDTANNMISKLVDQLGMDGKAYVSSTKCPMMFGDLAAPGKFFTAGSPDLKARLSNLNLKPEDKDYVFNEGLIIINKDYQDMPMDSELIVTCIHEKIHANRMVLAELPYSGDNDIADYFYDDGRFVKNSREIKEKYVDPSQEILLSSIDEAKDKVDAYNDLPKNRKDDLQYANDKLEEKMDSQYKIDESLVEIMAITAYQLSTTDFNIMEVVENLNKKYDADDIHAMTNIILRHNDLDLFKWMIDPLTYQNGNIHYDYFAHYVTDDDKEDVDVITKSEEIIIDDDELDRIAIDMQQNIKK